MRRHQKNYYTYSSLSLSSNKLSQIQSYSYLFSLRTITMGDGKQELGEFSETNTTTLALMTFLIVKNRRAAMASGDTGSKGQRVRGGQRRRAACVKMCGN
ncbi:hypothetical protein ACOSP7_005364 [Xanthoceras sorbifolium]